MRQSALILMMLVANSVYAANEEHFSWMGIKFCETSVGEALEQFPSAIYLGDSEILKVDHLGEALGGEFKELFFYIRPDGVVFGVLIRFVSGNFLEIEHQIDDLATKRWGDDFVKDWHKHVDDSLDHLFWAGNDDGTDVHMHLHNSETSPLYKLGQSDDGKKMIWISLRSETYCDLRN